MTVTETLRDLEQELFKVSVRKGVARVAELLADNFREFGSSGRVYSKAEIMDALRDEAPVEIAFKDFSTVLLTEDVALVTYRAIKLQDGAPASESLRSSFWQKTDDCWRMVFHQGTKVPEARD